MQTDLFLTLVSLVMLVTMFTLIRGNSVIESHRRIGFQIGLVIIGLAQVAVFYDSMIVPAFPDLREVHTGLRFLSVVLTPALPMLLTRSIAIEDRGAWLNRLAAGVLIVHAGFEVINLFNGLIWHLGEDGHFVRGPLYFTYLMAMLIGSLFLVVESSALNHSCQSRNAIALRCIAGLTISGSLLQIIIPEAHLAWMTVCAAMTLYINYYCDTILQMDALTRLLNRSCYQNELENRTGPGIFIMLDVDKFKHINDDYGHAYGDVVLSTIGRAIRQTYGQVGYSFRSGGDEFCVVMLRRLDEVEGKNRELCRRLDEERRRDARIPTVSIGYVAFGKDERLRDVTEKADEIMYAQKAEHHREYDEKRGQ